MRSISVLLMAILMLAAGAPAAENANDLFQKALLKERTEGNLLLELSRVASARGADPSVQGEYRFPSEPQLGYHVSAT